MGLFRQMGLIRTFRKIISAFPCKTQLFFLMRPQIFDTKITKLENKKILIYNILTQRHRPPPPFLICRSRCSSRYISQHLLQQRMLRPSSVFFLSPPHSG
mmetsp:Transcript_202/g.440  ORF Transcript_202/g.440 Transcript_202/m.440 type:complete len:100 (-) Transcript_202:513-812(-)